MTRLYRLDGRRLEGPLDAPTRNDSVTTESDDWASLKQRADALVRQGYTIWLYDHGRLPALAGTSDLRVIEQVAPWGSADPPGRSTL